MIKIISLIAALAITALASNAADILLAWDPPPADQKVTKYVVYEQIGEAFEKRGESVTDKITLTGVTPGKHTYVVTSVNEWGESGKSNAVHTPADATPPTGLRIQVVLTIDATINDPQK